MNKKTRICFITTNRADYGLLACPMCALAQLKDFEVQLIVTGAHLSSAHGLTIKQIEEDGFKIDARVPVNMSHDDRAALCQTSGQILSGVGKAITDLKSDAVVILGDRYEMLACAQAATICKRPIIHLAGGDITKGAFDDAFRNAISMLAHLHMPTNEAAAKRLVNFGILEDRIVMTGSTGIDYLKSLQLVDRAAITEALGIEFGKQNMLVTWHPETLSYVDPVGEAREMLAALEEFSHYNMFFTAANADPAGLQINAAIHDWVRRHNNAFFVQSMGSLLYFSTMKEADVVVGNSSSGLYEAPSLNTPTVNIGNRQTGRLRAASVVDCPSESDAIIKAILQSESIHADAFTNPYGDGSASEKFCNTLSDVQSFKALLKR